MKKKFKIKDYKTINVDYSSFYFDVRPFVKLARELGCWALIVVGARKRGKTYSTLSMALEEKSQIIFCKRTIDDVNLLCSGSTEFDDDLSPYADLNEDMKLHIKPHKIYNGIASFDNDEEGNKFKAGYAFAISAVAKYKGFGGLRKCKYLVFDEFIPAPWERIFSRFEGDSVLDLYVTASRDREEKGLEPMLFIALANANDLSNQLFNTLGITDQVADMVSKHEEVRQIGKKLVVMVDDSKYGMAAAEKKSLIYQDLKDTTWGKVTFNNEFARNDINAIGVKSIKGMKCRCLIIYKDEAWYVYQKDKEFYVCDSFHNHVNKSYNLGIESQQRACYLKEIVAIQDSYYKGLVKFQKFRMYDVIIHFKKFFVI